MPGETVGQGKTIRETLRGILRGATGAAIVGCAGAALAQSPDNERLIRLTPREYLGFETIKDHGGARGVPPLESAMLKGDPTRLGLYTILLKIPAHTRIAAHSHPDERVATVVEGTLHVGYGRRFDEGALKLLPPGGFFTEPANVPHFFRTGDTPAVLQITGVGPTGTDYTDPARQRFDSDR
jgi:quercetin dioxygenase-like cupin family protein